MAQALMGASPRKNHDVMLHMYLNRAGRINLSDAFRIA